MYFLDFPVFEYLGIKYTRGKEKTRDEIFFKEDSYAGLTYSLSLWTSIPNLLRVGKSKL